MRDHTKKEVDGNRNKGFVCHINILPFSFGLVTLFIFVRPSNLAMFPFMDTSPSPTLSMISSAHFLSFNTIYTISMFLSLNICVLQIHEYGGSSIFLVISFLKEMEVGGHVESLISFKRLVQIWLEGVIQCLLKFGICLQALFQEYITFVCLYFFEANLLWHYLIKRYPYVDGGSWLVAYCD